MLNTRPSRQTSFDVWGTIDLRSAGLFRVTLSLVLICQCATQWRLQYSLDTAQAAQQDQVWMVLSWLSAWPWATSAVLLLACACFVTLLIGYRTRLAACLSLVAFFVVFQRGVYAFDPSQITLLSLLLWTPLAPVGRRFSIDALRRELKGHVPLPVAAADASLDKPAVAGPRRWGPSLAALGPLLQVGLIAFYAAWLPLAPSLSPMLSRTLFAIEQAALPLIVCPWLQPWLRRLALFSLGLLCLAGLLAGGVGAFPWIMLAGLPLLLMENDWRA